MRHPKGCLIFYGMDTGLEESGPPEGRVKKCPVDTFLARGRVPRRKAQVGMTHRKQIKIPLRPHPALCATFTLRNNCHWQLLDLESLRGAPPLISKGSLFPHPSRLRRATFPGGEGLNCVLSKVLGHWEGIATTVCALSRNDVHDTKVLGKFAGLPSSVTAARSTTPEGKALELLHQIGRAHV